MFIFMNAWAFNGDPEKTQGWKGTLNMGEKNTRCLSSFLVCKLSWLLEMSNQAFLQS